MSMGEFGWLQFLHIAAVVLWIGGVFFLDVILVPALDRGVLDEHIRLRLLYRVLKHFFTWVWGAGIVLVLTGYGTIWFFLGGFDHLTTAVWTMAALGSGMVVLALYVFFFPFLRMRHAIRIGDWPSAARAARWTRRLSLINLIVAVPTILAGIWAIFGVS